MPKKAKLPPKEKEVSKASLKHKGKRPINVKSKTFLKKQEKSQSYLEDESSRPKISAVTLTPDGKKLTRRTSGRVIYGIRSGKTVTPLQMDPQPFQKSDYAALGKLLKKSASAQGKTNPILGFYEVDTGIPATTKTGRTKKRLIKGGPLKGQKAVLNETRLQFSPPSKNAKWRAVLYQGEKFLRTVHPFLQIRNSYEHLTQEMLNQIGFAEFKDVHSRFVGGYETKNVTLKGRTLTEALRNIQVPVSNLWLENKKVILKKFRDNQIGNIFVRGNTVVTIYDKKTRKKKKLEIPLEISSRYLGEVPNEIGRKIRQALADNGATYTSPKELSKIQKAVEAKFKSRTGGLMTEKARKELARINQPGANPKTARLKSALKNLAKGKGSEASFPLRRTDDVTVNLEFAFYRDPLAGQTKKKKKKKAKKKSRKK